MRQSCVKPATASKAVFKRLVTWIFPPGHVLSRTPAPSVICPITSSVLCQGKYPFRALVWSYSHHDMMVRSISTKKEKKKNLTASVFLPLCQCLIFIVQGFDACHSFSLSPVLPNASPLSLIAHLKWVITLLSMPMWAPGQFGVSPFQLKVLFI